MAVYLDHAATTPMPEEVLVAYTDALRLVGNPSSIHADGQAAKRMLEDARQTIAALLGADPIEVTFTSGGTESINLALKGLWWARTRRPEAQPPRPEAQLPRPEALEGHPPTIVAPRAEHHATLDTLEWLVEHEGAAVDWLEVDALGRVIVRPIDARAALVTTLWANTEVGTIQPIPELVAAAGDVPVHADAVGAFGALPIDFHASGLSALSVSAHKLGGPVGVGALAVRRGVQPVPLVHGGSQQQFRSGTQDAAGAHAFAVAAARAVAGMDARNAGLRALADRLVAGLAASVPSAVLRGDPVDRLPGSIHLTVRGGDGDSLLFLLDRAGYSVSTGSACQAGVPEVSHVLLAMGLSEADARGALRITLGERTTESDVDGFVAALAAAAR